MSLQQNTSSTSHVWVFIQYSAPVLNVVWMAVQEASSIFTVTVP